MADTGLKISKDGINAETAGLADLFLNLRYPQAKLDTSKTTSFQNIVLTFNNNPPEGAGVGDTVSTLVYRVPHEYTYAPSFWCLVQEVSPPAGTAFYQNYFQDGGVVASHSAFDEAALRTVADSTYINFYIDK